MKFAHKPLLPQSSILKWYFHCSSHCSFLNSFRKRLSNGKVLLQRETLLPLKLHSSFRCFKSAPSCVFVIDHRVTLLFVGDISFTAITKHYVEHGHHSYNDTFKEVASYIREADVSIGNLESPFVGDNMYQYIYRKGEKSVVLDSDPIAVSALR